MSYSSIPGLVVYRPGRSGGLPLVADPYCDRNTGPIKGPRRITWGGWPEEPVAAGRLGGSAGVLLDRGSIVQWQLQSHLWARTQRYHGRYAPLSEVSRTKFDTKQVSNLFERTGLSGQVEASLRRSATRVERCTGLPSTAIGRGPG